MEVDSPLSPTQPPAEIALTHALFAGLIDREIESGAKTGTEDMLDVIYGDTDSIMFAVPAPVLEGMSPDMVVKFASVVSRYVCTLINTHLHKFETIQDEKASILMLLPGMKKNYIMILTTGKKLFSGIEAKKRDAHPIVRDITKNIVTPTMMDTNVPLDQLGERLVQMVAQIKERLLDLVNNRVPHSQMVMTEKLNKAVYKAQKEITVVRDKRLARNEQVNVGERINYVLVDLDPRDPVQRARILELQGRRDAKKKNMEMAECAWYAAENAVPLNYEETFHRKIAAPILKLLRPFMVPINDFPNAEHLLREGIPPDGEKGKALLKARRQAIFDYQDDIIRPILFGELEEQFARRRHIRHRQIEYEDATGATPGSGSHASTPANLGPPKKRQRTLFEFGTLQQTVSTRERVCTSCNTIFQGSKDICNTCMGNLDKITLDLYAQYQADTKALARAHYQCLTCVADTGFPDLDVNKCTDYSCPVYEKRFALAFDVKAGKGKILRFQKAGACPDVVMKW